MGWDGKIIRREVGDPRKSQKDIHTWLATAMSHYFTSKPYCVYSEPGERKTSPSINPVPDQPPHTHEGTY